MRERLVTAQLSVAHRWAAESAWKHGTRPWSACCDEARETISAPTRLDPSDPETPAYLRSGMSDVERAVALRDAVVFGATIEGVKGENIEFVEDEA